MTAPVNAALDVTADVTLDTALLARARARSVQSRRALVDEIEAETALEPRLIVRALAARFGLIVAETADMLAFTPAFDLLPLAQALARHCVLLRSSTHALVGGNRSRPGRDWRQRR